MGAFTSRAGLYKPGGGSTGLILPDETVDIDKLNGNFDKIDALLGARNIPSASSYSGNMDGDLVYAQDTKFLQMYSADEGRLVTPKFPGSNAYAGTKAQRDAFSTAVEGDRWLTTDDDKLPYVRRGTEWQDERVGSGALRFIDSKSVATGALPTALTKISPLEINFTSTRAARYILSVEGKLINGVSGAWRGGYVQFHMNGANYGSAAPHTLDYPVAGSWASAVSDSLTTPVLPAGDQKFHIVGSASAAASVVPYLRFSIMEIM